MTTFCRGALHEIEVLFQIPLLVFIASGQLDGKEEAGDHRKGKLRSYEYHIGELKSILRGPQHKANSNSFYSFSQVIRMPRSPGNESLGFPNDHN